MIGLAIKFLLGGITRAAHWALSSATHLLFAACIGLAIWGWIEHRSANAWERAAAAQKSAYIAAQAAASVKQIALNAAISVRSAAIDKENSHEYEKALNGARSAVVDYARRMPAQACSPTGGTSGPAMPDIPETPASPGAQPEMVALTLTDLDTLAGNTVRAESCRALGQAWIDAGLAVAGD